MLDPFLLDHQELVVDDERTTFTDEFWRLVGRYTTFGCAKPDHPALSITKHAQTHEHIFLTHLATQDVKLRHNKSGLEIVLLDAIVLCQLLPCFDTKASALEERSWFVLRAMLKHRLIRLLLDLDHSEVSKLRHVGRWSLSHEEIWKKMFQQAMAIVRTIENLTRATEDRLYLATVYETVVLNMDLIVLSEQRDWCLSVKTRPNTTHITAVLDMPKESDVEYLERGWQRKIWLGTGILNHRYNGMCYPLQVILDSLQFGGFELVPPAHEVTLFKETLGQCIEVAPPNFNPDSGRT